MGCTDCTGKCTGKKPFFSSVLGSAMGFFLRLKVFLGFPELKNLKLSPTIVESCPNPNRILCTGMYWDLCFWSLNFSRTGSYKISLFCACLSIYLIYGISQKPHDQFSAFLHDYRYWEREKKYRRPIFEKKILRGSKLGENAVAGVFLTQITL